MVSVQIIRHNSSSALNGEEIGSIDYKSMEREFRRELNLLLDEEIKQDNDLSPKDPYFGPNSHYQHYWT